MSIRYQKLKAPEHNTYLDFIHSRTLAWCRHYTRGMYKTYAALEHRELTSDDKKALWRRLKRNHSTLIGIGSFRTLAMMESVMKGLEETK